MAKRNQQAEQRAGPVRLPGRRWREANTKPETQNPSTLSPLCLLGDPLCKKDRREKTKSEAD